jgi:hypothetical protein
LAEVRRISPADSHYLLQQPNLGHECGSDYAEISQERYMQPSPKPVDNGHGVTSESNLGKELAKCRREEQKPGLMMQHWLTESFSDGPFNNIGTARQATTPTAGTMGYGSGVCDRELPNNN